MAGSVTITRAPCKGLYGREVQKIHIDWIADAADGSVPNTTVDKLYGFLIKVVTNPGSVAPTSNYDIALGDPEDSTLDAAATLLMNRHTSTTEQVYPLISGAAIPLFLAGDYQFQLTNNSVNSATGRCTLYMVESL